MQLKAQTIPLPPDYEGAVQATIIKGRSDNPPGHAVLYIHGYIDYFFQTHMAERFTEERYNFYALDLRKYGRSLLPNQHLTYCRDLSEYFPEITAALEKIRKEGNRFIVLMGHSTGGLIASLYAAQGPKKELIDRLVLNSPFFEFNTGWFNRTVAIPIAGEISRLFPYARRKNELSPFYFSSIYKPMHGEWTFDTRLKPQEGVLLYFAWLRAVRKGQQELKRGLHIRIPVLVLRSDKSSGGKQWHERFMHTDTVLRVSDIARYAPRLGSDVTVTVVRNGLHDLSLSCPAVRDYFFRAIFRWLPAVPEETKCP